MLNPFSLILIALAYVALLFAIAWVGDQKRIARDHRNVQAAIYSLSLAVYCTSWTFYGAVGSAATTGWGSPAAGPRAAVPIHWGTYWPHAMGRVFPERLVEPPAAFVEYASELAPDVRMLPTAVGDAVALD